MQNENIKEAFDHISKAQSAYNEVAEKYPASWSCIVTATFGQFEIIKQVTDEQDIALLGILTCQHLCAIFNEVLEAPKSSLSSWDTHDAWKALQEAIHAFEYALKDIEEQDSEDFPVISDRMPSGTRTLDEIYGALFKTFEVVRSPGKNALVIQLAGYAQKLNCDPDFLRDALIVLHGQKRISTRKMNYPAHVPESWQIVFL